jgi:hypothetical protein
MDKHKILADAKAELERHVWGTFVEGKASVALGGTGVVVAGCVKRVASDSALTVNTCDILPMTCYVESLKAPFFAARS